MFCCRFVVGGRLVGMAAVNSPPPSIQHYIASRQYNDTASTRQSGHFGSVVNNVHRVKTSRALERHFPRRRTDRNAVQLAQWRNGQTELSELPVSACSWCLARD